MAIRIETAMQSFLSCGRPIRLHAHEPATPGRHPAVLLLHGAGGNAGFWLDRIAPAAARFGVSLYAAHYFDRTGTERASPEHLADDVHVPQWLETIGDAVAMIRGRPAVDPERIALIGISLGAFLSLALLTQAAGRQIRAVVDISGGLVPPFEAQATSAFSPTLIVHGEADTVVPVAHAHRLQQRLEQLGVVHRTILLPNEGHWFSAPAQAQILQAVGSFLAEQLLG